MNRFYKLVSAHETPAGWEIHLDTRPVKTPMKNTVLAPNKDIANEVVAEWNAQEETIKPDTMPITQILSTQADKVKIERSAMSAEILKFLDTDLLCYRAPAEPPGTAEKQAEQWNPILKWFADQSGVELETTTGLAALKHPKAAHDWVKDKTEKLDDLRFTILQILVPLSGSLILAFAFIDGEIDEDTLFAATHVEEDFKDQIYNAELYGRDPLQDQKDADMRSDLTAAATILKSL